MNIEAHPSPFGGLTITAGDAQITSQVQADRICVQLTRGGHLFAAAEVTPSPSFDRALFVMLCLLSRSDVRAEIPSETREIISSHLAEIICPAAF